MDEGRIDALVKRRPAIRRQAERTHRWSLPLTITHRDVARVMLATPDVLDGMALNSEEALLWLCNSCAGTDLVSREYCMLRRQASTSTLRCASGSTLPAAHLFSPAALPQ